MSNLEKMEKNVVDGYKKIEDGVVGGYKKIEEGVVGGFQKMADKFVDKHLTKEGETVEEAKERIAKEQAEREEKARRRAEVKTNIPHINTGVNVEEIMKNQNEMIKKSMEASMNAGKR